MTGCGTEMASDGDLVFAEDEDGVASAEAHRLDDGDAQIALARARRHRERRVRVKIAQVRRRRNASSPQREERDDGLDRTASAQAVT